jgi:hypothetical protein
MAMAKSGQARVLTSKQRDHLFSQIQNHRHPEKNTAIMQISFKLALRVQEIALLQIKEVARLGVTFRSNLGSLSRPILGEIFLNIPR